MDPKDPTDSSTSSPPRTAAAGRRNDDLGRPGDGDGDGDGDGKGRKRPADFRTPRLAAFDLSWSARRLANGMMAVHVPTPHDDHFFIGVMIKAGSRLELPAIAGVSHFLEHMMFRGSRRYPQFTKLAEAFEWLGGEWNAATGQEHTEYWYSGIRHTAGEVVDLFAEFLEHPMLSDVEIERSVITRELEGETNDHGHSLDLEHHVATLMWPGTAIAQPILGTPASLKTISVDTLRAYRDRYYTPRNMAVYVTGGDPDTVPDLLATHFGAHRGAQSGTALTGFQALPPFIGPAVKWVENSDNEYELKLSFLCEGEWSEDVQAYELITRMLSDGFCSRLARRLREELGLVYDISAHTSLGIDAGTIDVNASCEKDQLDKFLRELFLLLREFREQGPQADELERAAVRAVVDLELCLSHPEALGPKISWAAINGRTVSLVEERERLATATVDRIAAMLKALFRPERAALVALGPSGKDVEKRMRRALVEGLA